MAFDILLDILVLLIKTLPFVCGGCCGCGRMVVVQSVFITTKVVSSNPVNDGVYSIQFYVINFISDLRKVSGILLKVALNTINPNSTSGLTYNNYTFCLFIHISITAVCIHIRFAVLHRWRHYIEINKNKCDIIFVVTWMHSFLWSFYDFYTRK